MSNDLIKRSDAIKAMEQRYQDILRIFKRKVKDGEKAITLDMIGCIKDIPSADRPSGEWLKFGLGRGTRILFCTNCERRIEVPLSQGDSNYDFCPNCGARMKGADDEITIS